MLAAQDGAEVGTTMALPAKLRMPVATAAHLLVRERLFKQIEEPASMPAVWVCGPPGAGKTVLVQSWLQARAAVVLWYHVDSADSDPALLAQNLRLAAESAQWVGLSAGADRLPLLTPERRSNLDAFAFDLFPPLYEAMSAAQTAREAQRSDEATLRPLPTLVFDNIDEALGSDDFQQLLASGIECADPGQVRVVCIARTTPPGRFARLFVNQKMAFVSGEHLRATEAEAMELLRLRRVEHGDRWSDMEAAALNRWFKGWISGLVLVSSAESELRAQQQPEDAARTQRGGHPPTAHAGRAQVAVPAFDPLHAQATAIAHRRAFEYLATTVFERQTPDTQELMLTCALLPTFNTTMAEAQSGDPCAAETFGALARANLFVSLRAPSALWSREPEVYEFHALLREFLLARGRRIWSADRRRLLLRRAATLLAADAQVDAAAEAMIEAEAWDLLAALVRDQAQSMVDVGRQPGLIRWIRALPPDCVADDPWLTFWLGCCVVLFEPRAGTQLLDEAYKGFAHKGDVDGRLFAWCLAVEAISLEWRDFSDFDTWIERADALLAERPYESLPPDIAPRLACAMLSALMWRRASRPDVHRWHERARDAVFAIESEGQRILAGMPVIFYQAVFWGHHLEVDRTHARLRPVPGIDHLAPLEALVACALDATVLWLRGHCDQAIDCVRVGRGLRRTHGVELPGLLLSANEVHALATSHRVPQAAQALAKARATELDLARSLDVDNIEYLSALIEFQLGHHERALAIIRATNSAVERISGPLHGVNGALAEAQILHAMGAHEAARRCLDQAMHPLGGERYDMFEFHALACRALFDLDEGRDPSAQLEQALSIGARNDILNHLWFRPDMWSRLCAAALERGLQPDYARRLIQQRRLKPLRALKAWPWAVKIECADAGGPRLWVHGELLEGRRSRPDAPLRLLMAITQLARESAPVRRTGYGLPLRPVDRVRLAAVLRPDDRAASIDDWIHQNLKRLRLRLGTRDAIVSWAGKLALNTDCVWVDLLDEAAR